MKRMLYSMILIAVFSVGYNLRAFSPYPSNYLTRLNFLKGWSSKGFYAHNCSGFIADAHGEQWMSERDMYAVRGNLRMVQDLSGKNAITEQGLHPGDIAAFAGPQGVGLHVAAYEGNGLWIDSDSRRGYIAEYRMSDKLSSDPWFQGRVHIVRWTTDAHTRWNLRFYAEQEAIAHE